MFKIHLVNDICDKINLQDQILTKGEKFSEMFEIICKTIALLYKILSFLLNNYKFVNNSKLGYVTGSLSQPHRL